MRKLQRWHCFHGFFQKPPKVLGSFVQIAIVVVKSTFEVSTVQRVDEPSHQRAAIGVRPSFNNSDANKFIEAPGVSFGQEEVTALSLEGILVTVFCHIQILLWG